MKKFKKAMALSLALAMGLSLVACGGSDATEETEATDPRERTEIKHKETRRKLPAGFIIYPVKLLISRNRR